ncbi:HEXXH motif domain-containing protein [Embleya sp. NPDC059259]|uniref:HEXXH motif domain-containing protein n=1 Tax=unclassified Embleya TaxID=2699296 RepID=UPI0036B087D7
MKCIKEMESGVAELGSGYGGRTLVQALLAGQTTKRIAMLAALAEEIRGTHPQDAHKSGFEHAYQLLTTLDRDRPEITRSQLLHPTTGAWLASCMRRLRAEAPPADGTMWPDLGYLGWLASAAAIRAGIPASIPVVVRDGNVMLPMLGLARVAPGGSSGTGVLHWHEDSSLEIEFRSESLRITDLDAGDRDDWAPSARIELRGRDSFDVVIDDLDPFRDLSDPYLRREGVRNPPRLSAQQTVRWSETLAFAWRLMERDYPAYATPISIAFRSLVPLSAEPVISGVSSTSSDAFGCISATSPHGGHQMALTLVHEFQHAKLGALTDFVELCPDRSEAKFYAPWRDDPRPIGALLQGTYAHLGVTEFWRVDRMRRPESELARVEFARWRTQVERAIAELRGSGLLTEHGSVFVEAASTTLAPWLREEVSDVAEEIAHDSASVHRVAWCVRNRRVHADALASLGSLWTSGVERSVELPPSRLVVPHDELRQRSRLLPTYLKILSDASPGRGHDDIFRDCPKADLAYANADYAAAEELYAQEIAANPMSGQSWAGLALTLQRTRTAAEVSALMERGELVAQLYAAGSTAGFDVRPTDLVLWLSTGGKP